MARWWPAIRHRRTIARYSVRHMIIRRLRVRDIRFATSRELDGSDAMNPDLDYSAAS
jgi:hypothetical protein